jgi:SAM-dependent methyltransferase
VRLLAGDGGVRCLRCTAISVHLALGWALRSEVPDLAACDACEFSARGPLVHWLRRRTRSLATSEYIVGAAPGELRDGVRCEDMQRLSYADASFDLVTHTEVLEHVPDDARALRELRRVLRPGGLMLFSVPMHGGERTVERARMHADGRVEHLLAPVHHRDPQRAEGILAFRDYGRDLIDRLYAEGFAEAGWLQSDPRVPWSAPRTLVKARA